MPSPRSGDVRACRVCGAIDDGYFPYGPDGQEPDFEFCPCCDVQHGYEDSLPTGARRYREAWLSRGPLPYDDGMTTEQRLEQVPEEYR